MRPDAKPCTKQIFRNLSDKSNIPSLAPSLQLSTADSRNSDPNVWILWIHSAIFSSFPCLALNNWLAWKSSVLFSIYEFFRNSFNSAQLFKFLSVIAVRCSPLNRVNKNLYNTSSWTGFITENAVFTFPMNANPSCLLPLK